MGIVRVIKQNELQGGNLEDPIYPVTSTEAIYDLNNKKLSVSLEEVNSEISDMSDTIIRTVNNVHKIETDLLEQSSSINNINDNVEVLQETLENIKIENNPSISFKGILSGTTVGTRGEQSNINHNIECSSSFNSSDVECEILDLNNIKVGLAWFITKPGEYKILEKTFLVSNFSILLCVESYDGTNKFNLYDLGIPFIPTPTISDIGMSLKVSEDLNLYWG